MKLTLCFALLWAGIAFGQVEEVEEIELFEAPPLNNKVPSNLIKDYDSKHISNGYYWIYTRSESYSSKKKYGLLKDQKFILPVIFKRHNYSTYGETKDVVILSLGKMYGMYAISQQKWLIPMVYESIQSLKNNIYKIKLNGNYGLVDGTNQSILEPEWKEISKINGFESYFIVSKAGNGGTLKGVYSILQRKFVIPCEYDKIKKVSGTNQFTVEKDGLSNVISMSNQLAFKKWYDKLILTNENGNYIVSDGQYYGIIDSKERQVVPLEYQEFKTYPFKDGSYLARDKKGKYGFIKDDGTITLAFEYEAIKTNRSNSAISIQKDKCGLIEVNNGNPTEIVTCDYDGIERGVNVFVIQKGDKYGFMDETGKEVSELKYNSIKLLSSRYSESLYSAESDAGFYLVTADGIELNSTPFGNIEPIVDLQNTSYYSSKSKFKYLKTKNKKGKYQIVDKAGQIVSDIQFDEIVSESDNLLTVAIDGKYGMYSLLSRAYVIPCHYKVIVKDGYLYYGEKDGIYYSIVPGKDPIPLMAE